MKKVLFTIFILSIFAACNSNTEDSTESNQETIRTTSTEASAIAENLINTNQEIQALNPSSVELIKSAGGTCPTCWNLTYQITTPNGQIYNLIIATQNNSAELLSGPTAI
ncbi:hypothetical protein GF376_03605 [Candidatus Peregrinibacteria bacterium]|nr:hypothetical protein [Candidatus Peregrinibacteria bacterium]